jgi:hypothetical protein
MYAIIRSLLLLSILNNLLGAEPIKLGDTTVDGKERYGAVVKSIDSNLGYLTIAHRDGIIRARPEMLRSSDLEKLNINKEQMAVWKELRRQKYFEDNKTAVAMAGTKAQNKRLLAGSKYVWLYITQVVKGGYLCQRHASSVNSWDKDGKPFWRPGREKHPQRLFLSADTSMLSYTDGDSLFVKCSLNGVYKYTAASGAGYTVKRYELLKNYSKNGKLYLNPSKLK